MPTKAEGGAAAAPLPPATAPTLAASERLEQAWDIATALPLPEREELHRRLTDSLPIVVTAEALPSANSPAPAPAPYHRPAPRAAWWRRAAATAVDSLLLQLLQPMISIGRRTRRRRRVFLSKGLTAAASIVIYLVYHLGAFSTHSWPLFDQAPDSI